MDDNSPATKHDHRDDSHGWQTVTYPKRNRRQSRQQAAPAYPLPNGPDVFREVELHSEERLRAPSASSGEQKPHSDGDGGEGSGDDGEVAGAAENAGKEVKKAKPKKPKQPKVTVAEAAAKMDAADLSAYLIEVTESYEAQEDIQLMKFADYFGRAFSSVGGAQFPWVKMFKESPVAKLVDVPISHVPENVYETSVAWLRQKSPEALASFVLWSLDCILADLASHLGTAKGSKKVAVFIVLATALRRKPEVLVNVLPILKENSKYQGHDKLPVIIWMATQASQGDLTVGLYMWAHYLLPMLHTKSGSNPLCRDLVLQLVERILSTPKARPILLNGAVKKGERLVPPHALEFLMGFTFPAPSERVKATERFEAVYPTLKEVALTGTGGRAMKQVVQQIASFTIKAAGEGVADLSTEAAKIFVWCLDETPDSYAQWDKLYMDNLKASVIILRKLSDDWKDHLEKATEHGSLQTLRATLNKFLQKNEKALQTEKDADRCTLLKDADKHCRILLKRMKKTKGYLKSMLVVSVGFAVGAAIMSRSMGNWDLKKVSEALGDMADWDFNELSGMFVKLAEMLNLPLTI
ncbi:hypothetical protein CDL15_Pgr027770 [Punica granatum]|uniref:Uncharacterized protein n=1 Tax=Punica granatum TaxID=22663 RepID=A0A218XJ50_PUNGR|nr:hypothetical protein CDL15_Pgr027770 [Punica granatum]